MTPASPVALPVIDLLHQHDITTREIHNLTAHNAHSTDNTDPASILEAVRSALVVNRTETRLQTAIESLEETSLVVIPHVLQRH